MILTLHARVDKKDFDATGTQCGDALKLASCYYITLLGHDPSILKNYSTSGRRGTLLVRRKWHPIIRPDLFTGLVPFRDFGSRSHRPMQKCGTSCSKVAVA